MTFLGLIIVIVTNLLFKEIEITTNLLTGSFE